MDLTTILMLLLAAVLGTATDTLTQPSVTGFWNSTSIATSSVFDAVPSASSSAQLFTNSSISDSTSLDSVTLQPTVNSWNTTSALPVDPATSSSAMTFTDSSTRQISSSSIPLWTNSSSSASSSTSVLGTGATSLSSSSAIPTSTTDVLGAGATIFPSTASSTAFNIPPSSTANGPDAASISASAMTASASTSSMPPGGFLMTTCGTTTTIVPALTTTDGVTVLASPLPAPSSSDNCTPVVWIFAFIAETDRIFPIIQGWIKKSDDDDSSNDDDDIRPKIDIHFDNLIASVAGILPSIPKPPGGGGGCVASIFNLLGCINSLLPKIKTSIDGSNVDDIKPEFEQLKKLIGDLKGSVDEDNDTEPSSSSSQGCTRSSTSEAEYTTCSPSPVVTGTVTTFAEICETSTATVSGCSIAITGSATTLPASSEPCSQSSSEAEFVTCSPSPVTSGTLTTTTEVCQTSTTTVSGCSMTVAGSSTTLSSSSVSYFRCGDGDLGGPCAGCVGTAPSSPVATMRQESDNDTLVPRAYSSNFVNYHWPNIYDWPDGIASYILARCFDNDYFHQRFGLIRVTTVDALPTARYHSFEPDTESEMMVAGLHGCVSVVIVSCLGVYMSHIWQVPTFVSKSADGQRTFDRDIFTFMPHGDGATNNMPGLLSLTGEGNIFGMEGAETWAHLDIEGGNPVNVFIMAPEFEDPRYGKGLRFPADTNTIREAIMSWLPGTEPEIVPYLQDPMELKDSWQLFVRSARGKVLLQYDPRSSWNRVDDGRGLGFQCVQHWAAVRLFVGPNETPIFEYEWPSPRKGPYAEGGEKTGLNGGGGNLVIPGGRPPSRRVLNDAPDGPACWHVSSSASTSVTNSTSAIPTTLSTVPSSSVSTSQSALPTASSSAAASNSSQSLSLGPTVTSASASSSLSSQSTPSTSISDSANATASSSTLSYSSQSSSFAPAVTPSVSLEPATSESYSLAPSVSFSFAPTSSVSYSSSTTSSVSYSFAPTTSYSSVSYSFAPTTSYSSVSYSFAPTSLPPPTTWSSSTPLPPAPPPSPDPDYWHGACKIHIFEACERNGGPPIGRLEVSDGVGNVLYYTEPTHLKWDETFTADAVDTKLPWNIDVILALDHDSKRDVVVNSTHEALGGPRQGPVRYPYQSKAVNIVAGPSKFTSDDRDKSSLPHCKVGGWDNGNFGDFLDAYLGKQPHSTRDMDCFFSC